MKKVTGNRRVAGSCRRLRRALAELMGAKPLAKITIQELCEQAGVSRGTFYAHYTDLYDLLRQLEKELLEDFQKAVDELLRAKERNLHPVEITMGIFQCLKQNADICVMTLGEHGDKDFLFQLMNLARERFVEAYRDYFGEVSPRRLEYFYTFASAGCIGLLKKWTDEGMRTDAAEIARTAESLMLHGVGYLGENDPPPPGKKSRK